MSTVTLRKLSLKDYTEIVGENEINEIRTLAEKLADKSVVHVNSTSFGGADMPALPLSSDLNPEVLGKVFVGHDYPCHSLLAFVVIEKFLELSDGIAAFVDRIKTVGIEMFNLIGHQRCVLL